MQRVSRAGGSEGRPWNNVTQCHGGGTVRAALASTFTRRPDSPNDVHRREPLEPPQSTAHLHLSPSEVAALSTEGRYAHSNSPITTHILNRALGSWHRYPDLKLPLWR